MENQKVNENEIRKQYNDLLKEKEKLDKKILKETKTLQDKITALKQKSYEKTDNLQNAIDLIDIELQNLMEKSNFTDVCASCNIRKFKNELDLVTIKDMKLSYPNKNGPKDDGLLWCGC